jgi:hypothetical protein
MSENAPFAKKSSNPERVRTSWRTVHFQTSRQSLAPKVVQRYLDSRTAENAPFAKKSSLALGLIRSSSGSLEQERGAKVWSSLVERSLLQEKGPVALTSIQPGEDMTRASCLGALLLSSGA